MPWAARWSAIAPSAVCARFSAINSNSSRRTMIYCWSRGIRSTGSSTASSSKNLSMPVVVFSRRARDQPRSHDTRIRPAATDGRRGLDSPADTARPDRHLSTNTVARVAGGFWPGLRLPLLSDVFALRGRSGHHARRTAWRVAGRRAAFEVHAAASGRIGSCSSPRRASSQLHTGDSLIFQTNSDPFCNG